jgi:hypothetical protein
MRILVTQCAYHIRMIEQCVAGAAPTALNVRVANVTLPNAKSPSVVERLPKFAQIFLYRGDAGEAPLWNGSALDLESTAERGGMRLCKAYDVFP